MDYELYIGADSPNGDFEFSHWSSKTRYHLVFSDKQPQDMQVVPQDKCKKLSDDEKRWLGKCMLTVNERRIEANKELYLELLSKFTAELEKEIAVERELSNGKETDNGNVARGNSGGTGTQA